MSCKCEAKSLTPKPRCAKVNRVRCWVESRPPVLVPRKVWSGRTENPRWILVCNDFNPSLSHLLYLRDALRRSFQERRHRRQDKESGKVLRFVAKYSTPFPIIGRWLGRSRAEVFRGLLMTLASGCERPDADPYMPCLR